MEQIKKKRISWWAAYQHYVRAVVLPSKEEDLKNVSYWRNEIFCNILTYITPLSIIALVPSICMSFLNGVPVVGFADIFAFAMVIMIAVNRRLKLEARKFIFILILYCLSVTLLYYLSLPGPGLLFSLVVTIFSSLIYSSSAAYYSAWINTLICICFAVLIYLKIDIPISGSYTLGTWIAISSNLVLLSFVCARCLHLLLNGMETSIREEKRLEANLAAIIDNTDANIYSLDREFRYITFNKVLQNTIKQNYNIDIKPGDRAFDFLEKSEPEELDFWKSIYTEALTGKSLQFEKSFNEGEYSSTINFSINPIIENKKTIGLSCFAIDVTARKNAEIERERIINDLIVRNKNMEQFSYIISHNLRAPVANILGFTQLLQLGNSDPGDLPYVVKGMSAAAGKLDDVIKDLNEILQTRTQVFENKEEVYFQNLVDDITLSIGDIIKQERVIIKTDFKSIDKMHTVKSYLHSIFYNLIKNSIKFQQPGIAPFIEIKSRQTLKGLQLVFKDNGTGIDLEQHNEKLFGLYKRFHLHVEGKGMGLFMVKTQVETLGGKITVESEVNKGTEFIIEFENMHL